MGTMWTISDVATFALSDLAGGSFPVRVETEAEATIGRAKPKFTGVNVMT